MPLLRVPREGPVVDLQPCRLVLADHERAHGQVPRLVHRERPAELQQLALDGEPSASLAATGHRVAARAPSGAGGRRRRRATASMAAPRTSAAPSTSVGVASRSTDQPARHPLEVGPARGSGDLEVAHRSHGIGVYPRRPMPAVDRALAERRPRTAGRARASHARAARRRVPGHRARPLRARPPQPLRAAGRHDPVRAVHRRAGEHGHPAPVRALPDARRTLAVARPAGRRGDHPLDRVLQEQDQEPPRDGHRRGRAVRRRGAQPRWPTS